MSTQKVQLAAQEEAALNIEDQIMSALARTSHTADQTARVVRDMSSFAAAEAIDLGPQSTSANALSALANKEATLANSKDFGQLEGDGADDNPTRIQQELDTSATEVLRLQLLATRVQQDLAYKA